VGYDDAPGFRIRRGLAVELYGYRADFLRHLRADDLAGLGKRNVFVVLAGRRLGCRREYHFRQPLSLSQPRRELDAAHHSRLLVALPPGADDAPAYPRLDQQRLDPAHDHRAPGHLPALARRHYRFRRDARQVIGNDMSELLEPEERHLGQYPPLLRYRVRQDHVERRESVGLDHEQPVGTHRVEIAHLAAVEEFQALEAGFKQCRVVGGHLYELRDT